jgi:hypothetical protein
MNGRKTDICGIRDLFVCERNGTHGRPSTEIDTQRSVAVTKDGWPWIVDAHKDDGKRYIVQSDELLSAFLELEPMLL